MKKVKKDTQQLELSRKEVHLMKEAWRDCLPSELANLFYYNPTGSPADSSTGVQRINSYNLANEGITKLSTLGTANVDYVQIVMGVNKNETPHQFSPIFKIVARSLKEPVYYQLYPNKVESALGFFEIEPNTAQLFHKKWQELTEAEIASSFTGQTIDGPNDLNFKPLEHAEQKVLQVAKSVKNRRVRSYKFDKEDMHRIINYIDKYQENFDIKITLYLGAGLTVHLSHPFSFRPVLDVSAIAKSDSIEADAPPSGEDFERSKPCPPFCPDDDM